MINSEAGETFLRRLGETLDWGRLEPWTNAIETKLGMPVSVSLYKMILLERWFAPSSAELDDACHGSATVRRFLGAPLHGPVAEVWMHRQFAARLGAAATEISQLLMAIDRMLVDRGIAVPGAGTYALSGDEPPPYIEGTRTTAFEVGKMNALDRDDETANYGQPAHNHTNPPVITQRFEYGRSNAIALLVWPWGAATGIDRTLCIGRDATFSPYARQLWADPGISRRHAELEPLGHGIGVRDLGSSNGTYIDDRLLPHGGGLVLTADATLRFGTDLTVKLVFVPTGT